MRNKQVFFGWFKSLLQAVVIFTVLMWAVDWYRRPQLPEQLELPVAYASLAENQQTALVYFWAEWCGVCRYSSPVIEHLYQDGAPVVGVALRSGSDKQVADYLRKSGLSFPNINDPDGQLAQAWQVKVTPTVVLMKNGKIVGHTTGVSTYWGLKARLWWANWIS